MVEQQRASLTPGNLTARSTGLTVGRVGVDICPLQENFPLEPVGTAAFMVR